MKPSQQPRKKYFLQPLWLLAALLGLQSAQAQFTFPIYEPFSEYPEGERLRTAGSSGVFWNFGNSLSSTTSPVISTNYALSYPGLLSDQNSPARGILGAQGAGRTHAATFTAQTSGTNYLSFLFCVSNLPSADRPIIGLNAGNSGTPGPSSGPSIWITPTGQLKLDKSNSTTPQTNTTPALAVGSTYLVVMAYKFPGTGTNEVDLWLNPTILGNNANVPAPTILINNNVTSVASLQSLCLYSGTGIAVSTNLFDEIRVTADWASATPAGPSPGPAFAVTLTGSGSGCPGDAFPIGLSGSVATNVYLLYTNAAYTGTSVAGSGSAITFGPQSTTAIYTVLASNINTAAVGWMTNSVAITVLAPPSITSQPVPVTVATNGYATFSVTATGSGLNYQWYKNGAGLTDGGDISGATTPTLTVSPATAADQAGTANGYYAIITNRCGATAISATNALILDKPANLVWQGSTSATNWDLAASATWTSAGNPTIFNAGDNVTFDDTSLGQVATLVGNLAPGLVIENSSLAYFFNGSGRIVGACSLVMNGTGAGSLTISNANSFTGGTIINSGRLIDQDSAQLAMGSGTVTLAGGTLEMGLKSGSATTGLSNVNVTATSTLQYDGAGSFAQNILGALTGSAGATLTVQGFLNNSATPDRMRLYGTFTNNSPIIIGNGSSLDMVELAPYHTSGSQVYNGVISGTGGRLTLRGAGAAILNGANTFNDSLVNANGSGPANGGNPSTGLYGYSVLISSGNLGIGADSAFSTPPTLASPYGTGSSPVGTGILGINNNSTGEGGSAAIFASGGAHTVANPVIYTTATNTYTLTLNGSNNLTFSGPFYLNGADGTGTNRVIQANNTGFSTFSGAIQDAGLNCGIIKTGTNALYLNGANIYTGSTTVSNGVLAGTGTISGPVAVAATGAIGAGSGSAIGTLTVNNSLTIEGGGFFRLNKSLAQSNDLVSASGALTNAGTGTISVTNLGAALVVGDKFFLFNKAVSNGVALTITGGGMNWTNKLAVDGSIQTLSAASTIANYSTNITFTATSTTLTIKWPATHLGWLLQSETNTLGAGLTVPANTWHDIPGSDAVTQTSFGINPANPTVFYRLRHP